MFYTVRYCHLKKIPGFVVGDKIINGNIIGTMGNSGKSYGAHLHIDCVEKKQNRMWSLGATETGLPKSAHRQLNYFIDDQLFRYEILITTYYNDPEYMARYKKVHLAYDVVPLNRRETDSHYSIYWNRSKTGYVTAVGNDTAYGNYIMITFEA